MNKRNLLLILSFLTISIASMGYTTTLSMSSFRISPGQTKDVTIELNNPDMEVIAIQLDLILPGGITMPSKPTLTDARIGAYTDEFDETIKSAKTISYGKVDGNWRFVILSLSDQAAFSGTSGAVINLKLKASDTTRIGDMTIKITGIELSPKDLSAPYYPSDVTATCKVRQSFTYNEASANSIMASTDADVTLNRSFIPSQWNTICLPYTISSSNISSLFGEGTKVAEFTGKTNNLLNFTTLTGDMLPNTPYLIKPTTTTSVFTFSGIDIVSGDPVKSITETDGTITFKGVYSAGTLSVGDYYISDDKFCQASTTDVAMNGFGAYFTYTGTSSTKELLVSIDGNEPTSMSGVIGEKVGVKNAYTLSGQRINSAFACSHKMAKGIYIINGKKIVVK